MKKLFYIISLVALASFAAISCQPEVQPHEPGPQDVENCYGVYFPAQEASGSHVFNPTQDPTIDFIVARTNTKGAITVPYKAIFSEDVFKAGEIVFADGQEETTLTVRFDEAVEGKQYSASFIIEDNQYASLYNNNPIAIDFSLMRVEMLTLKDGKGEEAVITFTENFFEFEVQAKIKYYEVAGIRTCETFDEVITGSNFSLIPVGNVGFFGCGENNHLKFLWNVKNNKIDVKKNYLGFDYNDGNWIPADESAAGAPMYYYDWFWWYNTDNTNYAGSWTDWEDFESKNPDVLTRSSYDGNGGLYFSLKYYIPGLGGWSPDDDNLIGIIPGYSRVDYTLELESDYSYQGEAPIYVTAGADVASLKYAVYEGELTATQIGYKIDAIIAGTEETASFDALELDADGFKYGTIALTPEKTGTYTFVTVAYDADGKDQNSGSVIFKCIAAADEESYAVDINVFTEPTPERYAAAGYDEYSSFAFGIYGSGITEAHIDIVETSKITNAYLSNLKYNAEPVSEELLAQINAAGGLYDVVGELDADTQYAVVVWATNGSLDAFAADYFTTEAIPEVWNPLGKGQWTDGFFESMFSGLDPLTWEVEVEQSADDPTRIKVVYPYDGKYAYNEAGDWDESKSYDIILNVPDPEHVYIVPQKTGVNWGYGNMIIASTAGRYVAAGYSVAVVAANNIPFLTLKDGVISGPEAGGGLVMNLPDYSSSYFTVNDNSSFKLVLPEGVKFSAPAASAAPVKTGKTTINTNLTAAPEVKHVFERDAQPVNMKATVSAGRKAKDNASSVATREPAVSLAR